jgi:hypothetical protein
MRRILIAIAACAVLGAVTAAPASAVRRPLIRDAGARVVACHQALFPSQRYLLVEGTMGQLAPGLRLQMRFDLYRRYSPTGRLLRVSGPGLGVLLRAGAGVTRYRYDKRVLNLYAAQYRMIVTFRWTSASGRLLAQTVRWAPLCSVYDLRPNLQIPFVSVTPTDDGAARYDVYVRNAGRTTATNFDVGLSVAGVDQAPVTLFELAPGAGTVVSFAAPRCAAGPVVATVDPDGRVSESSELDNSRIPACAARRSRR